MDEHVSDERMLNFLRKQLHSDKFFKKAARLNTLRNCSVRLIHAPAYKAGAFIISNGEQAKLWGVQRCKSSWACPVCSASKMARYAADIAAAIDALEKQGQYGFMITFCVPHLMKYTCKQVYDILTKTWERFTHHGNGKSESNPKDIFGHFARNMQCEHRIRVCEFTWGKNGWHPHFHCIFFVPKHKLQDVAKYQKEFTKRWLEIAKQMTSQVLCTSYGKDDAKAEAERLFANISQPDVGAVISLDDKGKVRRCLSSDYICGWGADRELTGNYRKKASNEGHYTPHQLLEIAYEANQLGNYEDRDKFLNLYIDYANVTLGKYRVRLSKNLRAIIETHKHSLEYIEVLKKKATEKGATRRPWYLVCWFTEEQWFRICTSKDNLIPIILELAANSDVTTARQKITNLLLHYAVDIRTNPKHKHEDLIVGKLFNHERDEALTA